MMPESGPEEVVVIEEQVRPAPSASRRAASPARIAGMVLGSTALGLAATTIAMRLAIRNRGSAGRRRGPLVNFQPRVAVFAPSMTITLPFSGISGQAAPGRSAPARIVQRPRRGGPPGTRRRGQMARQMAEPSRWLPRPVRRRAAR